jgi:hypothetical protein
MLFLSLSGFASAEEPENALRAALKPVFEKMVVEIVTLKEAQPYFGDIALKAIEASNETALSNPGGWILRWRINKGTEVVRIDSIKNPMSQAAAYDKITDKHGIIFDIFIAYENADSMTSRNETYDLSKKPRIVLGYLLQTQTDNPALRKQIEHVISLYLPFFQEKIAQYLK